MLAVLTWLNPIMVTIVTVFTWFTMKGYLAFPVTERHGLAAVARNFPRDQA
jgi:hypothetical protein